MIVAYAMTIWIWTRLAFAIGVISLSAGDIAANGLAVRIFVRNANKKEGMMNNAFRETLEGI